RATGAAAPTSVASASATRQPRRSGSPISGLPVETKDEETPSCRVSSLGPTPARSPGAGVGPALLGRPDRERSLERVSVLGQRTEAVVGQGACQIRARDRRAEALLENRLPEIVVQQRRANIAVHRDASEVGAELHPALLADRRAQIVVRGQ